MKRVLQSAKLYRKVFRTCSDYFGLLGYDMHFQTRPFILVLKLKNNLSCVLSPRTHAIRIRLHLEDCNYPLSMTHNSGL